MRLPRGRSHEGMRRASSVVRHLPRGRASCRIVRHCDAAMRRAQVGGSTHFAPITLNGSPA